LFLNVKLLLTELLDLKQNTAIPGIKNATAQFFTVSNSLSGKAFTFVREMLYVNALITRFRPLSHQKTGNG
jgi:hypothetical protein